MAKRQITRGDRSPLVPISVNAFLTPAFNAWANPLDLEVQETDPGFLRYTRARAGKENFLPHTKYFSRKGASAVTDSTCSSPIAVRAWSPEPVNPRSRLNFTSPKSLESLYGSFSPSSCFSTFNTPTTPRFKLSAYSPAQFEEDVLVMDGIVLNNDNIESSCSSCSFRTPEQACRKQRSFSGSTECSSIGGTGVFPAKSLYKTEICRSWEEMGTCRYGLKCQFAHGKDDLRPAMRHPKYKTEICRAFMAGGTCPYGARCRFIHRLDQTNNIGDGNGFNFPANLEVLNAGDLSPGASEIRTRARRLPIFENICPSSPDNSLS